MMSINFESNIQRKYELKSICKYVYYIIHMNFIWINVSLNTHIHTNIQRSQVGRLRKAINLQIIDI